MLKLITGDTGSGKTAYVIDQIRATVDACRHALLIVPEQQTVSIERLMAEALPASACLSFEVTNFSRLSDMVFRRLGGLADKECSPAAQQVLMWRTLSELSPMLRSSRPSPDARTVSHMCTLVSRMRACRITPAMLEAASASASQASAEKLRDYALISKIYHDLLCEYFSDTSDRLDRTAALIQESNPFEGYAIFVHGFSSFTGQQYAVLEGLLCHHDVTITLCLPPKAQKQLCAVEVNNTLSRLTRLAEDCCVSYEHTELKRLDAHKPSVLRYVAEHLYRVDYKNISAFTGDKTPLTLVEAPEPQEACDYICADILRRVSEEGCSYRDFAVVCGSASSYEGILDAAMRRNGIPCFLSHTESPSRLDMVRMIFCAYRVVLGGWKREDVIAYLKCQPHGIDPALCDLLELYAYTWDICGARWYDGKPWEMNPFGFSVLRDHEREEAERKLAKINECRASFVLTLYNFGKEVAKATNAHDHVLALTNLLLSLHFPEQAEERGKSTPSLKHLYDKVWDNLCNGLDNIPHVLGDTPLTARDFASLLEMQLDAMKTGQLPATVDEVTVGEAALLRTATVPHVYLLGANEGEFPATAAPDTAFTEEERLLLVEKGATALAGQDESAARELYAFWRAFSLGHSSVTLLWSCTTPALEDASPSSAALRVAHLAGRLDGEGKKPVPDVKTQELSPENLIWTLSSARERIGRIDEKSLTGLALRALLKAIPDEGGVLDALDYPICNQELSLSAATAKSLYDQPVLTLSQTRINAFLECQLSYLIRHTLGMKETPKARFDALSVGNFVHAVLEHFFRSARKDASDETKNVNLHQLSPAEQATYLDSAFNHAIKGALPSDAEKDPSTRHLLGQLKLVSGKIIAEMCEELSHSKFTPMFFELPIKGTNSALPSPVTFQVDEDNQICVAGIIDRVDTWKSGDNVYIRVVDYKTGEKTFDKKHLESGEDLQMPLYLFSLLSDQSESTREFREKLGLGENGTLLPAGVLYLSSLCAIPKTDHPLTGDELTQKEQSAVQRSGIVPENPDVLIAIDDTPDHRYLPVKASTSKKVKPGEFVFTDTAKEYVYTNERYEKLYEQIGTLLTELGKKMKRGLACAAPLVAGKAAKQCESCAYKPICRNTRPPISKSDDTGEGGGED